MVKLRTITAMQPLDFALLRTFLTVFETKSISRAAQRIGLTQAAVSLQMQRLERILGAALFLRNRSGLIPTPQALKVLPYAQQIVALQQQLVRTVAPASLRGSVRFGCPEDVATTYLPHILQTFQGEYPQAQITVTCDLTAHLLRDFSNNHYDLIVIKQPKLPLQNAEPLRCESLVWVASHANVKKECVSLICAPAPCVYRACAIQALDRCGIPWSISYTSPSLAGICAALRAGLGVAIVPHTMVPDDLTLLRDWPPLDRVTICSLQRPGACPLSNAFLQLLKESINKINT